MISTVSRTWNNYIIPFVILAAVGLAVLANAPERSPYRPKSDLTTAVSNRDVATATKLLNGGADVNGRDGGNPGWAPIHFASAWGDTDMLEMLIRKGANVNLRDGDGNTPLHVTKFRSQADAVDLLIMNKAQVNAVNNEGKTPLHLYVQGNSLIESDAIEKLLKAGANPMVRDASGKTPYDGAKKWNNAKLIQLMEKYMPRQ